MNLFKDSFLFDLWSRDKKSGEEANKNNESSFHCLLIYYYKNVENTNLADEETNLLDNLLFLHPVIDNEKATQFIGSVLSFFTFYRINYRSNLKNMSWERSNIAIESLELSNGDSILFVAKLPVIFSFISINKALSNTLKILDIIEKVDYNMLDEVGMKSYFRKYSSLIISTCYPRFNKDNFSYSTTSLLTDISKKSVVMAMILFEHIRYTCLESKSALFINETLVLSEIEEPLLGQLLNIERNKDQYNPEILSLFSIIKLELNYLVMFSNQFYHFFILLDHYDQDLLTKLYNLIMIDIGDYASLFYNTESKLENLNTILYFRNSGRISLSRITPEFLDIATNMHNRFDNNSKLKSFTHKINNKYYTGLNMINVELLLETDIPDSDSIEDNILNDIY